MPRWDRELAGRLISQHRVTHWTCIPTMVIDLFGSPNYKSFDLSSLRNISGGGAAMPHAVAQRLHDEFGLTFAEGYGLTETAAPSHANPPERAKLQCLGIPIFGVDSRVVDPVTLEELPPGEVGEIITRGPMVFTGLLAPSRGDRRPRSSSSTAASFFRTGDLGRMDEEGYFFITDRLKRMINASGFKVWPAEVEMLLYKHPAVQEACIIAARDAYRGETVKAVVVLRAEAKGKTSAEDIIAWAREHMAAYKVPKIVEFVDALPKSGSGKVMWRLLQDQEAARSSDRPRHGARSSASPSRTKRSVVLDVEACACSRARRDARPRSRPRSTRSDVERVLPRRGRASRSPCRPGRRAPRSRRARSAPRSSPASAGVEVAGEQQVDAAAREHLHRHARAADELDVAGLVGQVERMVGDDDLQSPLAPSGSRRRAIAAICSSLMRPFLKVSDARGVDAERRRSRRRRTTARGRASMIAAVLAERAEEALPDPVERHVVVARHDDLRRRQAVEEGARLLELAACARAA